MAVLQNLIASLFFITLGMHHVFIRAIIESYTLVPIGTWHISGELVKAIITITIGIFLLALKLMAPVMASIMASTVALGVMSRVFPQMNIFMMSFPLNIGLGLLVLGITMNVYFQTLGGAFIGLSNQINAFLKLMGA
jgi:flagellar biosynthetic protein FliR